MRVTLQVGSWSKSWEMPFADEFDLLEVRVSKKRERHSGDREDTEARDGKLVEGYPYVSRNNCVSEDHK